MKPTGGRGAGGRGPDGDLRGPLGLQWGNAGKRTPKSPGPRASTLAGSSRVAEAGVELGEAGSFGGPSGREGAGRAELPGGGEEVVPISGSGWGGPGRGSGNGPKGAGALAEGLRVPDSYTG